MKVQILLVLVAGVCATVLSETADAPYSIIAEHYIPLGEKIRQAEERMINGRIVGGSPALLGEIPYQVGALTSYIGISGTGICGGSLVTVNRVVSAASCWNDGVHIAHRVTVVLGSITLFSGGTRIDSSVVAIHPSFSINLFRFDVSVIYLPTSVTSSATIAPISLPAGAELNQDYAGSRGVISGYGVTENDGVINQNARLFRADVTVISNSVCSVYFPFVLQNSHICSSGIFGAGTCRGDSGSPLVVNSGGRPVLIGISSFISARGCESASGFTRVTHVIDFIRQNV